MIVDSSVAVAVIPVDGRANRQHQNDGRLPGLLMNDTDFVVAILGGFAMDRRRRSLLWHCSYSAHCPIFDCLRSRILLGIDVGLI
jgi:hypothetical protein